MNRIARSTIGSSFRRIGTATLACIAVACSDASKPGAPVVVVRADGTPAVLVPVSFATAPSNGSLIDATGNVVSSLSVLTDTHTGLATVKWRLPSAPGYYSIVATTPAPNDGGSPLTITATVQ